MKVLGITGGIGSGKSHVCSLLKEHFNIPIFYTDIVARQLIETDEDIKKGIKKLVGSSCYDTAGNLNKKKLRTYIQKSEQQRHQINQLVHPKVIKHFIDWKAIHAQKGSPLIALECALLFETELHTCVDITLGVFCDEDLRIRRVMQRDQLSEEQVRNYFNMQTPSSLLSNYVTYQIDTSNEDDNQTLQKIKELLLL